MRHAVCAALIAAATLAGPASAEMFRADNGVIVHAEGPDRIVVPMSGRGGAIDFWCAAGDYVYTKLGVPTRQILYRVSEPPRRSGEPIVFSLNKADQASSTGTAIFGGPGGGGMSVGMARSFCETSQLLYEPD